MLSKKNELLLLKLLSLFSVVRGYNILILITAQYLASVYIFSPNLPLHRVVFDFNLFVIVLASALAIASGYIINNFYDAEKDLINKPQKSMLDQLVSQRFKLTTYFILNFMAIFAASYISFRAVVFFFLYIFGLWFYSHKLKRIPFVANLVSATLAITPFFIIFVYYRNFQTVIFVHALFLFLLILAREMIKDLVTIAGDMVHNYKTIPVCYGSRLSKCLITGLITATLVPAFLLINTFEAGYMDVYLIVCIGLLASFLIALWRSNRKKAYVKLHNLLKIIIICGVFSILLIDVDVVLHRIL